MPIQSKIFCNTALVLCVTHLLFACNSEQENQAPVRAESAWEMSQQTDKQKFSITFQCAKKPFVGDFQVCDILLTSDKKPVSGASISIDGGMQAHGHGLPTAPKMIAASTTGQYRIEGLKFSMPGEWIVGFRVKSNGVSDQTVFKFSI